jgi:hypothetical protein
LRLLPDVGTARWSVILVVILEVILEVILDRVSVFCKIRLWGEGSSLHSLDKLEAKQVLLKIPRFRFSRFFGFFFQGAMLICGKRRARTGRKPQCCSGLTKSCLHLILESLAFDAK